MGAGVHAGYMARDAIRRSGRRAPGSASSRRCTRPTIPPGAADARAAYPAVKDAPPTSAPRRCCPPSLPACTYRLTTARGRRDAAHRVASRPSWPPAWHNWALPAHHASAFDTLAIDTDAAAPPIPIAARALQMVPTCAAWDVYLCVSLDRPPPAPDVALLWRIFADWERRLSFAALRRSAPDLIKTALVPAPHAPGVQHPPLQRRPCCATSPAVRQRIWRWTAPLIPLGGHAP